MESNTNTRKQRQQTGGDNIKNASKTILAALIAISLATLGIVSVAMASEEEGNALCEEKKAERISQMDTDGDGEISEEEKNAFIEEKKAERISQMDTDGDGEISEEEKNAFIEEKKANWKEKKADWKEKKADWREKKADWKEKKTDWREKKADWKEKKTMIEEKKAEKLSQIDTDGDGEISEEEKNAWIEEHEQKYTKRTGEKERNRK